MISVSLQDRLDRLNPTLTGYGFLRWYRNLAYNGIKPGLNPTLTGYGFLSLAP